MLSNPVARESRKLLSYDMQVQILPSALAFYISRILLLLMYSYLEKIQDKPIIVEGKKDKIALENLGCSNVIMLNGNRAGLFRIAEKLPENCKEAVILTDLDKKGKQLYHRIKKILTRNKIKVDDRFRIYLFKETKIRQIEGLKIYMKEII
ncbi:toprim domain-containing protein [Candidatus Woesearchaeota archaeon]|nr:toprim domain-containing protein [Candidatus Woesearchaeota archaeon]